MVLLQSPCSVKGARGCATKPTLFLTRTLTAHYHGISSSCSLLPVYFSLWGEQAAARFPEAEACLKRCLYLKIGRCGGADSPSLVGVMTQLAECLEVGVPRCRSSRVPWYKS